VKWREVPTAAAVKIGIFAPLLGLVLLVAVTVVSVLWRAAQGDDDDGIKSRPLHVVFPLAALVGAALLAGCNALLALLIDGGDVAHAAAAGVAAGAVAAPLLLAGLLVGFSATPCFALPFAADVGALLLATQLA
jgi:hypothetical protein